MLKLLTGLVVGGVLLLLLFVFAVTFWIFYKINQEHTTDWNGITYTDPLYHQTKEPLEQINE